MTHVLVIDDDLNCRNEMQALLESAGFDVTAAGGQEGCSILEGVRSACLVVATTLASGRETAIQMVRNVRAADSRLGIVVVANGDIEQVEDETSGLDVWAVIEKPYELEKLAAKVGKAVEFSEMSMDCKDRIADNLQTQAMAFQRVKRETQRVRLRMQKRPREG
ncbi:MAG TPA: hypothetical protein VM389_12110 [Phycisphaerae bacterium]|nr:hypothetical protein [Phycisphaerae bacterium]